MIKASRLTEAQEDSWEQGGPLDRAAAAAWQWLLCQSDHSYPDATHNLRFPRRQGFRVKTETQSSDLFARATLANILLDCAELVDDKKMRAQMIELAQAEADYLAQAKLTDRAGGWSYFPKLPELPPDADSLATLMTLFQRIANHHLELCERPIELLLEQQRENGSFSTWLIAPEDPKPLQRLMHRGVKRFWRREIDLDVNANIIYALQLIDAEKYSTPISKAQSWLATTQQTDGAWPATWYWHHAWPAWLCLRALPATNGVTARNQTFRHLCSVQNKDGGWGPWQTVPLETATTTGLLAEEDRLKYAPMIEAGLKCLLDMQTPEGNWQGTSWIRMPVPGRSPLSWGCDCITTAVSLRTLLGELKTRSGTSN